MKGFCYLKPAPCHWTYQAQMPLLSILTGKWCHIPQSLTAASSTFPSKSFLQNSPCGKVSAQITLQPHFALTTPTAIIEKSSLEGIKDFLTNWVVHAKREIHSLPAVAAPSGTVTAAPDTSTTPAVNGIVNTTAPTTPTAVQQPTAETPILPSTQPEPAVFPAEATDTKAQESWSLGTIQLNPTVVIGGGVLLLLTLLMFGIVSYVNLRLLNIESNLTADWRNKNLLLEEKVLFLEDFVQSVSETLTGKQGSLDAQWKHWKTREEFVTQVDRWKQKIEHIQSTLQQSQQVLRSVGQEMMDHATKSPSADKSNPK